MHSVFVVVITSRTAGKTISSWQHIEATRLSHSRKLGIGHRNRCHYHMQKTKHEGYEGCKGWSIKLLGKTTCWVLVFSHRTLHLIAQPTVRCIYQFLLGDLFFLSLSTFFFPPLSVNNVSNSFNRCLLNTCYMKSTVLGTRKIGIYK